MSDSQKFFNEVENYSGFNGSLETRKSKFMESLNDEIWVDNKKARVDSSETQSNGNVDFNDSEYDTNFDSEIAKTLALLPDTNDKLEKVDYIQSQVRLLMTDITCVDIVQLIEELHKSHKDIAWRLELLNNLHFAKNIFGHTPQIWYNSFDLLKQQHDEIMKNVTDFNAWVMLLQYSESLLRNQQVLKEEKQKMALEVLRNAFDEFLQRYPYCYGYWKNYSDIEKKFGTLANVFQIFEKALLAFPTSVDLWIFYLNFVIENSAAENANPFLHTMVVTDINWSNDSIRSLFQKAQKQIGSDYKAEPFWDLYISWETKHGSMKTVTKIYDLVLQERIAAYKTFFDRFKNHIETNDLLDIMSKKEIDKFKRGIDLTQLAQKHNKTIQDDLNDEQIIAIRERIIQSRQEVVQVAETEVKKRKIYEDNIKRPYFHIKPLERFQLRNWKAYLDYEINQTPNLEEGEKAVQAKNIRVKSIFERCLVTATLYEEFWLKYARYLENIEDLTSMRKIFQRACLIHLPTKPNIFLTWAGLEEKYGNYQASLFILDLLDKNVPDLVQLQTRRINLLRRMGHDTTNNDGQVSEVESLYKANLTKYAGNLCYYSYFVLHYARYLLKVKYDRPRAQRLLEEAIVNDPHNEKLYLQLLDIEYQSEPLNVDRIVATFDLALTSTLPDHSKVAFAQRKYEFLESIDTDVYRINKARDEYTILLKHLLGGDFGTAYQRSYVRGNVPVMSHRQQINASLGITPIAAAPTPQQTATNVNTASVLNSSGNASGKTVTTATSQGNNNAKSSSPQTMAPDHFNLYYQQMALSASLYYPMPAGYPTPINPMFPYPPSVAAPSPAIPYGPAPNPNLTLAPIIKK